MTNANYTPGEWQRAMLGAAAALAALRLLVQEHLPLLQQQPPNPRTQPTHLRTVSMLLARALQSDLVVKSAKVAAAHSSKARILKSATLPRVYVVNVLAG